MVRRSSVILFNGACGGGTLAALLVVTLMLTVSGGVAEDKQLNETSSSSSLVWTAAKEEYSDNLMLSAEPVNESSSVAAAVVGDHDELDGGFSSLEGMLQWAIGHSDPDALKQSAQDAQRLSAAELKKRQMEIKELMEKMKMPSDAQLMQTALDDLNNLSLPTEDRNRALQELLILVEPIDNANDLNKLGGLALVIRELNHPESEIRTLSAWVLGKASQNNAVVQKQVLELGALSILMKMASSNSPEEAIKALYAVSALIRNNLAGQDLFYSKAGDKLLLDMLRNSSSDLRLCKKAVSLVSDLAENELEYPDRAEHPCFGNRLFLKSIVDLTLSVDIDLQEKALLAIKNLLQLETANAVIFKDFCELDAALARMRRQLRMLEDSDSDFAENLETLIREVQSTFHRKLGEEEMRVVQ
ncbi:Hsp70 nucleotide exchange factor fes1 [Linum grandiflorum]